MILVTGATGLLGSHLCYLLLKEGKQVVALKRKNSRIQNTSQIFSYYNQPHIFSSLVWEEGDILDLISIDEIIKKYNISEIYHCAALVSFEKKDIENLHKVNTEGTANMVNLALENKIEKFCFASSIAALSQKKGLVTENHFWKSSPNHTTYAVSKYAAEREVWRGMEEGLNAVIVNPSLIIGPGCWNQSSGKLITNAKIGIKFFTSGGTGLVDVRDVVHCMFTLMQKSIFGQRFILNSENLMFKEILSVPQKEFGHSKLPFIKISKFMFRIAYKLERILCVFNGKEPRLSKEFIKSGFEIVAYSNKKIKDTLGLQFISIEEAFKWTCKQFLIK